MTRVAIYYDVLASTGFRDDGCPLFINYNLRKILNGDTDLTDHKRNVVHLSPCNPHNDFGKFDLHILVDYGEDALGIPLDWKIPHPNAYWCSDAHLGYDYRLKRAKEFDFVFVAQKEFIDKFVKDGIPRDRIFYLPHAFEPDCYKPTISIKKWDWCFIGYPNSEHRIDLLDRFIKEFPNYYLGWRTPGVQGYNELEDVSEKLNFSKVGINYSVKSDLNMRIMETLGTKTLLLTDDIEPLHEYFEPGEDLFTFKNIDDAVDQMRMILREDPVKLDHIRENGYQKVINNHTYWHRAMTILKTCLQYEGVKVC